MNKFFLLLFLFWVCICFNNQDAYAYPNFIRLGYNSCMGCHYNPAGGGMLTPYGKGISSTQSYNSSELSESEEEKISAQKYFQAFQGRILNYKTEKKNRIFPMQAEYFGRYDFNSQIKANFSIAVAPKGENVDPKIAPKTYERIYVKNVEINFVKDKNHQYFLGISNLPVGLGLIDHTNYVRTYNRLSVTDIPFNLRAFVTMEKYSYNYFFYLPHYQEAVGNKEKGMGGQYWYLVDKNFSIGAQSVVGTSVSINRELVGMLLKGGLKEYSYLGEYNFTHRKIRENSNQFGQWTFYNQFTYHPKDWMSLGYAFQGLIRDRDFDSKEFRHSFLFQAKIFQNFTLMYETRIRRISGDQEISHLLQGFFQWW